MDRTHARAGIAHYYPPSAGLSMLTASQARGSCPCARAL